jgi:hypothetical protein
VSETETLLALVIWSALVGAFVGGILWLIATKWKPVAESNVARPIFKILGGFVGIGLPSMAVLASVAHLFL